MDDLSRLTTEQPNPASVGIDTKTTLEILRIINGEDATVPQAVRAVIPEVATLVDILADRLKRGGRLFYVGAGTSGRLGILDAAECPPTFGTDPQLIQGIIAGGHEALLKAVEWVEDREEEGAKAVDERKVGRLDVLLGITASGQAPFVIGAMKRAGVLGATVAALSCNRESKTFAHAKVRIFVHVGPEIITGSTRMKSGTAQKLVLNMITTTAMIRMGKVYNNLMVDLVPVNSKLVKRSKNIIQTATGCDQSTAEEAFVASGNRPKVAIVMVLLGVPKEKADELLEKGDGRIGLAVRNARNG